jgi:signal transduction histidine kinase
MRVPGIRAGLGIVALWVALVGLSLWHNLGVLDTQVGEAALARSRMMVMVIQTTRLWNARHGGVYVPTTDATPPNEWLKDPERDVTVSGRAYTKINPAYMTRQVADMISAGQGMQLRLTSRKPIRPANAPDPWEDAALAAIEAGRPEVLERVVEDGRSMFRYMARLPVEEPCLKCHAEQGYRLGDVRGGLSVGLPAAEFVAMIGPLRQQTVLVHGLGFLILSGGSLVFLARLRQGWLRLEAVNAAQERVVAERTAALRTANAELHRSNAELENFAYIASHDLQEPLRMVGGYAQLLEKRYGSALDADGREFLGYMNDGALRMKQMIDDLLAYSRVGRNEPVLAPVSLEDILDMALANLAVSIAETQAEIIRPAPLPQVLGEAPLLVRLLQNLLGNALKYRAAGQVPRIIVSSAAIEGGWRISVADNGIGVPEAGRERIFQIFQRLHSRSAYPGTGIGLAIAKKIVDRHGGRIWVEAAEDGGSVFHFTVMAAEAVSGSQQGWRKNSDCS